MNDSITVSFCLECAKACGYQFQDRIGGTFLEEQCQLCGKEAYLGEYISKIPLDWIKEDSK